jgi:hypothetical protein
LVPSSPTPAAASLRAEDDDIGGPGESAGFQLARELRNNVPAPGFGGLRERGGERGLDGIESGGARFRFRA